MASLISVVAVVLLLCVSISVTVRAVAVMVVMVAMAVTVVRGGNGHLKVVPGHVGEDSVLEVTSEETLLREGVSVLLGVHSPSIMNGSF